jgi:hypothetical protein
MSIDPAEKEKAREALMNHIRASPLTSARSTDATVKSLQVREWDMQLIV